MAKAVALSAADLVPGKPRTQSVMRQRGVVPSAELVPLQFRMPPEFVRAFKQAALDRDLKLNELLNEVSSVRTLFEQIHLVGRIGVVLTLANLRKQHIQRGLLKHGQAQYL